MVPFGLLGKTTVLVDVICRYIFEKPNEKRRLMVTAPSNKAVTVLASRVMDSVNHDIASLHAVLIGDADKLLGDDANSSKRSPLRSIFVFSYVQSLVEDYNKLKNTCLVWDHPTSFEMKARVQRETKLLGIRIRRCFVLVPEAIEQCLKRIDSLIGKDNAAFDVKTITCVVEQLQGHMLAAPKEDIAKHLLASADVIFCTLVTSGCIMIRETSPISDLIVDEAAAATEPELCIPFHLRPSRLLAVGDPLQLPSVVKSKRAERLGLAKSLHERLMYGCGRPYIMLNKQYRMNPTIASFPSYCFYESKVKNGKNVAASTYKARATLLDGKPFIFLRVKGFEEQLPCGSYQNLEEAEAVVDLVKQLRDSQSQTDPQWFIAERIRVITFYRAQATLLNKKFQQRRLGKVVAASVDSSQGCEAEIVILSFVRSFKRGKSGRAAVVPSSFNSAGFLEDDRRMNVALTRAKHQLICVGNTTHFLKFQRANTIKLLVRKSYDKGQIHDFPSSNVVRMQTKLVTSNEENGKRSSSNSLGNSINVSPQPKSITSTKSANCCRKSHAHPNGGDWPSKRQKSEEKNLIAP